MFLLVYDTFHTNFFLRTSVLAEIFLIDLSLLWNSKYSSEFPFFVRSVSLNMDMSTILPSN